MTRRQQGAKRRRGRRTLGASLLLSGLLTAGVWLASCWYYSYFATELWSIHSYDGIVCAEVFGRPRNYPKGWSCTLMPPHQRRLQWRAQTIGSWGADHGIDVYIATFVRGGSLDKRHAGVSLALWPWPPLLAGAGAALWFSARRRAAADACTSCGYSRVGLNASTPCPECGQQ